MNSERAVLDHERSGVLKVDSVRELHRPDDGP